MSQVKKSRGRKKKDAISEEDFNESNAGGGNTIFCGLNSQLIPPSDTSMRPEESKIQKNQNSTKATKNENNSMKSTIRSKIDWRTQKNYSNQLQDFEQGVSDKLQSLESNLLSREYNIAESIDLYDMFEVTIKNTVNAINNFQRKVQNRLFAQKASDNELNLKLKLLQVESQYVLEKQKNYGYQPFEKSILSLNQQIKETKRDLNFSQVDKKKKNTPSFERPILNHSKDEEELEILIPKTKNQTKEAVLLNERVAQNTLIGVSLLSNESYPPELYLELFKFNNGKIQKVGKVHPVMRYNIEQPQFTKIQCMNLYSLLNDEEQNQCFYRVIKGKMRLLKRISLKQKNISNFSGKRRKGESNPEYSKLTANLQRGLYYEICTQQLNVCNINTNSVLQQIDMPLEVEKTAAICYSYELNEVALFMNDQLLVYSLYPSGKINKLELQTKLRGVYSFDENAYKNYCYYQQNTLILIRRTYNEDDESVTTDFQFTFLKYQENSKERYKQINQYTFAKMGRVSEIFTSLQLNFDHTQVALNLHGEDLVLFDLIKGTHYSRQIKALGFLENSFIVQNRDNISAVNSIRQYETIGKRFDNFIN